MDELEIEYYHIVDEKALQIRIDYNVFEKDIDIYSLCKEMGLVLVKYSSLNYEQLTILVDKYCLNDALTLTKNNTNYIFYNDKVIESRTRFSLAHEIDHITDTIHPNEKYIEKVADDFNVSLSAATYALDSALKWENHPNFKFTEKETEYLKLYKKYNEEK